MKRTLLSGAFLLFGLINAQEKGNFKIGAHLGVPTGNLSEYSNFNLGVDVAYTFKVSDNFDLGFTTGYSHYFSKDKTYSYNMGGGIVLRYELEDSSIIPVAAMAQYTFNDTNVFFGTDLGYAFFVSGGNGLTGAFYYQPKLGYSFVRKHDLYLSYKGMSRDGQNMGSFNLGYAYKF